MLVELKKEERTAVWEPEGESIRKEERDDRKKKGLFKLRGVVHTSCLPFYSS